MLIDVGDDGPSLGDVGDRQEIQHKLGDRIRGIDIPCPYPGWNQGHIQRVPVTERFPKRRHQLGHVESQPQEVIEHTHTIGAVILHDRDHHPARTDPRCQSFQMLDSFQRIDVVKDVRAQNQVPRTVRLRIENRRRDNLGRRADLPELPTQIRIRLDRDGSLEGLHIPRGDFAVSGSRIDEHVSGRKRPDETVQPLPGSNFLVGMGQKHLKRVLIRGGLRIVDGDRSLVLHQHLLFSKGDRLVLNPWKYNHFLWTGLVEPVLARKYTLIVSMSTTLAGPSMSQNPTSAPRLLIVDDDQDIRLILRDLLEGEGYLIDAVGSGTEAIACARDTAYQAVVLDIGLPDMDGFSVLGSLLESDPDLPVIVLSAHRSDEKTAGSLQKGAFAYLAKPYNNDVLKATLEQAVGIKYLSEEASRTRAALVRSEDQFRAVVQSAPDAIVLADDEGRIISWNLAAERLFGYREDEVMGHPLTRLMPERYRDAHVRGLTRFKTGSASPFLRKTVELAGLRKDGTEFPIELSLGAWKSSTGPLCFSGIIRDISERKRWEESQASLAAIVESSADAIIGKTLEGTIVSWNSAAEHIFGYTAEEAVGSSIMRLIPPERRSEELQIMDAVKDGRRIEGFETVRRRKDGRDIHVSLTLSPIRDRDGFIVGISNIARDITNQRHAQDSQRRRLEIEQTLYSVSARFLQTLDFEEAVTAALADMGKISGASRAYVFLFRDQGAIMDCAYEWCALGVNAEKERLQSLPTADYAWAMQKIQAEGLLHIPDTNVLPPEAYQEKAILEAQAIKSLLNLPIYAQQTLAGFIGFDNVVAPQPWRDEDLLLLRLAAEILGHALQRTHVETSLRTLQRQHESILDAAGEGIYGLDEEGRVTFINPAAAHVLGWRKDDLLGQRMHALIHHTRPDGSAYPDEECPVYAAYRDGQIHHSDAETFWRKDGTAFPVEFVSTPLFESGAPKGAVVVFKDITHRKWSESALQESRERLQQLADHIHEVFWLTDPSKEQMLYISQGYEEIWGRSREVLYEAPRSWLEAIHPEDRARVQASALTRQMSGDYDEVYRVVRSDGTIRWIHDRAFPIRDKAGRVYRIAGIAQDITTQKAATHKAVEEGSGGHDSS